MTATERDEAVKYQEELRQLAQKDLDWVTSVKYMPAVGHHTYRIKCIELAIEALKNQKCED